MFFSYLCGSTRKHLDCRALSLIPRGDGSEQLEDFIINGPFKITRKIFVFGKWDLPVILGPGLPKVTLDSIALLLKMRVM